MLHEVVLSLASNRFQKSNLCKARLCLAEVFADLHFTRELWTEPMGSHQRPESYLNQLGIGLTALDEQVLGQWLKGLERRFGRSDSHRRLGIVPLDVDILSYDGLRRHLSDWQRPYVEQLIGDLPNVEQLIGDLPKM